MELTGLATLLQKQIAAGSSIVLDSTILDVSMLDEIRTAFALPAGTDLTIAGLTPEDVPTPTADGVLALPTGTATGLNQSNIGMTVTFTEAGGTLQVIIVAVMREAWRFTDSFGDLTVFPFPSLATHNARFVFASAAQPAYAWPGESDYSIALEQGLNFLADVTLDPFPLVTEILADLIKLPSYKFYGPFGPKADQALPVGALRAPISDGSFGVGVAPNLLTLSAPAVVVQISDAVGRSPIQEIDLFIEADFQKSLRVEVGIPRDGGALTINAKPLPKQGSIKSVIEMLPGGKNFNDFIPSELSTIFSEIDLDNFSMVVDSTPEVTYLSLALSTNEPWPVIPPDVLILEGLIAKIQTIDPAGLTWTQVSIAATAAFLPNIFKGEFDFTINVEKNTAWEVETVSGAYYGIVSLGDIVGGLLGNQDSVPATLRDIQFADFSVSATRPAPNSPFTYRINCRAEAAFPILERELTAQLNLSVTKASSSYEIVLTGAFVIGQEEFNFELDLGTAKSEITATWAQTGDPLEFSDIASALGWDSMPTPPENLDLGLTDAQLTYNFSNATVALTAHSVNYGELVFASQSSEAGSRQYVFALEVPADIELSNLPVVGDKLPANIGISDLQLVIASAELSENDVSAVNALLKTNSSAGPSGESATNISLTPQTLAAGPTIAATLHVLTEQQPLIISLTNSSDSAEPTPAEVTATSDSDADPAPAPAPAPSYQSNVKWFTVGKSFGPVSLRRMGVQYLESILSFVFDAAISAGGLTLTLEDLSVGSQLTKFTPQFSLHGLGIDYSAGDVEISGAFLRVHIEKDGLEYDEYDGGAIIKTSELSLSALGSYAKPENYESLFIYGVLNYPFGGPPFFFVTGLAAGFGYNRAFIVPPIDDVAKFPLIQEAVGGSGSPNDLMTELETLRDYIPATLGDTFLAVGVKFTSFKMIDSFALLAFVFGTQFEIDVLGLSTLIVPTPEEGKSVTPLAEVQMALRATFIPAQGFLGVSAQLTSASYVFSKDCHLTGGFAFYSWFSGPHAGDFVQTLGGYHPSFNVPAHYPQVPRLALNWQIDDHVSIKGDLYYALTASTLMAGGSLQATWSAGDLKAWFNAGADFLIAWKPYHYDAKIYIDMGVSYTFSFFGSHTISVDVGADLHVWGPEFSGTAHIHLWIVSFTVSFGAGSSQTPQPIDWTTFSQSFLPAASDVCSIAVKSGLIKKVGTDGNDLGMINPKDIVLTTNSVVPSTGAKIGAAEAVNRLYYTAKGSDAVLLPFPDKPQDSSPSAVAHKIGLPGVGSMAIQTAELTSTHFVTITYTDEKTNVSRNVESAFFKFVPILKNVPAGLWGESLAPNLNAPGFVEQALTGFEISPKAPPAPGTTMTIPRTKLQFEDPDVVSDAFTPQVAAPLTFDRGDDDDRRKTIDGEIAQNAVRAQVIAALGITAEISLSAAVADEFLISPQIVD